MCGMICYQTYCRFQMSPPLVTITKVHMPYSSAILLIYVIQVCYYYYSLPSLLLEM